MLYLKKEERINEAFASKMMILNKAGATDSRTCHSRLFRLDLETGLFRLGYASRMQDHRVHTIHC